MFTQEQIDAIKVLDVNLSGKGEFWLAVLGWLVQLPYKESVHYVAALTKWLKDTLEKSKVNEEGVEVITEEKAE